LKIAVTADCHLASRKENPGRYAAFETLLLHLVQEKIGHLIVAGDLFDEKQRNYSEFEALCSQTRFKQIQIIILPGNHDAGLSSKNFSAPNLSIIETPEIMRFDMLSMPVLLIPYETGKTMGEKIAPFAAELKENPWILISHGDWISGLREPNPYEPGVYLPLTKLDVNTFSPSIVILGHIHKPVSDGLIHYPGSLYPLDINETGRRRFIVLDTEKGSQLPKQIFTDKLFFQADLTVLPLENEAAYLHKQIKLLLDEWKLSDQEKAAAIIRIKVHGYSTDKSALLDIIRKGFAGFGWWDAAGPDLTATANSDDRDLEEIARLTSAVIEQLDLPAGVDQPGKDEIIFAALETIYGD